MGAKKQRIPPPGFKFVPPDGGFGWIVCAGAVLAGTVMAIPLTAFGLILGDLMSEMDTNTATASWIPSLCVSMSMFGAPFNSMIIDSFSARVSTMAGGLLTSVGMILSYFVYRVEILYITYGLFVGAGLGMVTNSSFIVLSQYFRARYGLATGINIASFAVGRLIFTPIIQVMLDQSIDFRGVLLICGGLTLNICVGAALFQPAEWHLVLVPIEGPTHDVDGVSKSSASTRENGINGNGNGIAHQEDIEMAHKLIGNVDHVISGSVVKLTSTVDLFKLANSFDAQYSSMENVEALVQSSKEAPPSMMVDGEDVDLSSDDECTNSNKKEPVHHDPFRCLARGPFKSINFNLLKAPILYLLLASGTVGFIAAVYASVFLVPLGTENGIPAIEVATVASIRAGAEVIGRIAAPYLYERFHLHLNYFYIALLALHGVTLIIIVFTTSFASMLIVGIIAGLFFGGVTGLAMVNIVDCVGVALLGSALSITQFIQSFLALGVGPMIGHFRDATGSFALCFYFLAGTQFLCCVIWAFKSLAIRKSNLDFSSSSSHHK